MTWEGGGRVHTVEGDPGGTTKWGISQRAFPRLDIANLTAAQAQALAHEMYWQPVVASALPPMLRWDVFDFAFNAGVGTSARALQKAINLCKEANGDLGFISEDGHIGPITMAEVNRFPPDRLRRVFRAYRIDHYMALAETGRAKFIHGWLRRAEGGSNDA